MFKWWSSPKKSSFLLLPTTPKKFHSNRSIKAIDYRLSDGEINQKNKLKYKLKRKSDNIKKNSDIKSEIKFNEIKNKKFSSSKSIKKFKNTNIDSVYKFNRKTYNKKNQQVNKELNTISQNIKNTNNAINNPNEFYMNFFNNIIQRSGYCDQEDEEKIIKGKKEKKISITNHSGIKHNYTIISARDKAKDMKFIRKKSH